MDIVAISTSPTSQHIGQFKSEEDAQARKCKETGLKAQAKTGSAEGNDVGGQLQVV